MAFHQGQFGLWNWFLMLGVASLFAFIAIAALVSYLKRRPENGWGIPKVPKSFKVGYSVIAIILILGIVFPLFGVSIVLITLIDLLRIKPKSKKESL